MDSAKMCKINVKFSFFNIYNFVLLSFILLFFFVPSTAVNTVCQAPSSPGSNTFNYSVCMSDPKKILLPNTTIHNLTVAPPSITCGATLQPYCTSALPTQCFNCSDADPALKHPKEYLTDLLATSLPNYQTSWQSQTWAFLGSKPTADIIISMGRRFILQDDIVFTFAGGRPKEAILEKSMDNGSTWTAMQYFNRTCRNPSIPTSLSTPTDVICTERFSSMNPVSGGELRFNLNQDRLKTYLGDTFTNYARLYDAYETTPLLDFLTFTDIRLRLIYPATDGNEINGSPLDFLKYYYSISNVYLVGGCDCNRHAKFCQAIAGQMRCVCEHHTDGANCERCLPLYNNRPWKKGSFKQPPNALPLQGTPNECQKCECYNKATSCVYEESSGKGRCLDCQNNSQGDNCDECKFGFYRNATSSIYDVDMCSACVCEPLGIADGDISCLDTTGQCKCKAGVLGTSCDTCFDGTWGLLAPGSQGTCKPCTCNREWTVDNKNTCDQLTGQCNCVTGVHSVNCTLCKDGYYRKKATEINQQTCVPCLCNWGGSTDQTCDKTTSQCPCKLGIIGTTCSLPTINTYVPLPDYIALKPDHPSPLTTCFARTDVDTSNVLFSGRFYFECYDNTTNQLATFSDVLASVSRQANLIQNYIPVLRFNLEGSSNYGQVQLTVSPDGQNLKFNESYYPNVTSTLCDPGYLASTFNVFNLHTGMGNVIINESATVQLDARCKYKVTFRAMDSGSTDGPLLLDSVVLVPDYRTSLFYTNKVTDATKKQYEMCIQNLMPYNRNLEALLARQECLQLYFAIMSEQFPSSIPCDCDATGSKSTTECKNNGGQCDCKDNVTGRKCNMCKRGFYGFSATGCKPCNCDKDGSSNPVCDYDTGQCPCKANVAVSGELSSSGQPAGLTCNFCKEKYYGVTTGGGCMLCNCNIQGSSSLQCGEGGKCSCKDTIGGEKCDQCLPGYHGFSSTGCQKCECNEAGSVDGTCSNTGVCLCKKNVEGIKCQQCKANTFNMAKSNPDGCQPCYCSKLGQGACTSAYGFKKTAVTASSTAAWPVDPQYKDRIQVPQSFLGNKITSYTQYFSFTYLPNETFQIGKELIVTFNAGATGKVSYSPPAMSFIENQPLEVKVQLHESQFQNDLNPTSPLTSVQFYDILAKLSSITIQRSFLDKYIVSVSQVSMVTAGSTDVAEEMVSYVENCTCTLLTAGFSCERCKAGYKRKDVSTPTSGCEACTCLGLTTSTQQCHEETGVCLNCPAGSLGDNCGECAANVVKDSQGVCNQCAPNHWGLSSQGCQACGCTSPGSADLTTCDLVTGQCGCRSNVTGRTCDSCLDGYVNMTIVGCSPCGGCYNLVVDEMNKLSGILQTQIDATTSLTSKPPSSFSTRLSTAQTQAAFLIKFDGNFDQDNMTLWSNLQNITELYNNLNNFLTTTITPKWGVLKSLESATHTTQRSIEQVLKDATESLLIVALGATSMQTNTQRLTDFKTSIENIKNLLESGIQPLIFGYSALNATVTQYESQVALLNELLNDMRTKKMPEIVGNNQKIMDIIATIDQSISRLNSSAQSLMRSAINVKQRGALLTNQTTFLFNKVRDIKLTEVDVQGVSNNVSLSLPNLARQLSNAAEVSRTQAVLVESKLQNITTRTNELLSKINLHLDEIRLLGNRVTNANKTATESFQAAQSTVSDAVNMLDVMRNFDQKANALQAQASSSIESAEALLGSSRQAISNSQQISSSAQPSLDTSNQALSTVSNTLKACNQYSENIKPVYDKSTTLFSEAAAQLNDVAFKQSTANISPARTFTPVLNGYRVKAAQLEKMALDSRESLQTFINAFSASKANLQNLLSRINSIVSPSNTQTSTLLSECEEMKRVFQQMTLSSVVAQLQNQYTSIKAWVEELKKKRSQLQNNVKRLQIVVGQLD